MIRNLERRIRRLEAARAGRGDFGVRFFDPTTGPPPETPPSGAGGILLLPQVAPEDWPALVADQQRAVTRLVESLEQEH